MKLFTFKKSNHAVFTEHVRNMNNIFTCIYFLKKFFSEIFFFRKFTTNGQQSRHRRYFIKKKFLKILQIAQENNCVGVSFYLNCRPSGLQLYWKETPTQVFFCKIDKILKSTYLKEHLWTTFSVISFRSWKDFTISLPTMSMFTYTPWRMFRFL